MIQAGSFSFNVTFDFKQILNEASISFFIVG